MSNINKVAWVLRHEDLWNDREGLKAEIYQQKIYSPKLSNIDFVIDGLLQKAKRIKKRSKTTATNKIQPKTDLIISQENFDELITMREVKDILLAADHPVKSMTDASYTYFDYAVFKRKKHGKVPARIIDEINVIFSGGDVKYIY